MCNATSGVRAILLYGHGGALAASATVRPRTAGLGTRIAIMTKGWNFKAKAQRESFMTKFIRRLLGAAMLLPYVYEEIEADPRAFGQALAVVSLSSIATGAAYWTEFGIVGVLAGLSAGLAGWVIWTWLTYHIGTRWLPESATKADWGELLRTTGFATAPGILRVLALVPDIRDKVLLFTAAWMLVAFVLAVRQALDYAQTWRALVVCLAGWIIAGGLLFVVPQACELEAWPPRG